MPLPHDFTTEPLTAAALMETLDYLLARAVAAGSTEGVLTRITDVRAEAGELRFITEEGATLASVPHSPFQDRGAWSSGTAYVPGDLVLAGGGRYLATVAHMAGASLADDVAAGRFSLLLPAAQPGAVGALRGPYDGATRYDAFDLVIQGGQVWQSLADGNLGHAVTEADWWAAVGVRLEGLPLWNAGDAGRVLSPLATGVLTWRALTTAEISDLPSPTPEDVGQVLGVGAGPTLDYVPPAPPGLICAYAGAVAPAGWLLCDGALVSRTGYAALFAAIGERYGAGDGTSTFALPDFRGRMALGVGTGSGLTGRTLGETGGAEAVALSTNHLPSHKHGFETRSSIGDASNPRGPVVGSPSNIVAFAEDAATNPVAATGGDEPHPNMPPFLGVNHLIKT